MALATDPLRYLSAGWLGSVMGRCGPNLAWQRAISLLLLAAAAVTLTGPGLSWFAARGMLLALSTRVVAALKLATLKGLRSAGLLVAEPVPVIKATLEQI